METNFIAKIKPHITLTKGGEGVVIGPRDEEQTTNWDEKRSKRKS